MPTDRLANLDRAVALLIQHNARLSKKLDVILDSNRRLHGRLRELEAKTSMATSSSDEETVRRKSTRQRRNPFDRRYWELGEPPMSPDERESDQESVDTLPARRQQNDTGNAI
ncbi:hypothetical protein SprV_0200552900 [Sparganum proliferum]